MENNAKIIMHLSLIPHIGPATIMRLAAACKRGTVFGDSLEVLYRFSANDFQNYGKISKELAERLVKGLAHNKLFHEELELVERHEVSWITLLDKGYPSLLKHIHAPPVILYCMGTGDFGSKKQLAIVGSRKADLYGKAVLAAFIPEFVKEGYAIVSGGAVGIDAYAHQVTLEAGGITGAVLGSGLLKPYPPDNLELFKTIVDKGGYLMSPFPLRTEPQQEFFPARNRIIAGLSRGTLVVQAAKRSGALITASFALEEGREVFAVPGRVDNPLSVGCHALLSEGALVASSASAVLSALDSNYVEVKETPALKAQSVAWEERMKRAVKPTASKEKQLIIEASSGMDRICEKLYTLCFEPQSLDELIEKSGFDGLVVQEHLWDLVSQGKMFQASIGMWKCN